jgi:hypothetical protein
LTGLSTNGKVSDMDKLTFAERRLLANLLIRWPNGMGFTTLYNARKNYPNLTLYRSLERKGKLRIFSAVNATTENMLYGMTSITFKIRDN